MKGEIKMEILIGIIIGILIVNLLSFITLLITNEDEFKVFTVAVGLLMPIVLIINKNYERKNK
jgi:hypothetical protein